MIEVRELNFNGYKVLSSGLIISKKFNKPLNPDLSRGGYSTVTLCYEGKNNKWFVHRLVANLFIENNENKPCVNHKDGNKKNNNVSNLEWVTYSENTRHSFDKLGKEISHSEETKKKMSDTAKRNKTYLKNFKYTKI